MWPSNPDSVSASLNGDDASACATQRAPSDAGLESPQPRILLVDDDAFMLGIHTRVLQSMGYRTILGAGTAQVALQFLEQEPDHVDVIICDLNMPGMDGIEFLQTLNTREFRGNVILLSGEGIRVMHTVQKLLDGSRLVILGSLEKPPNRVTMRSLLDAWRPTDSAPAQRAFETFTPAELLVAHRERQWVLHYQPKVAIDTGMLIGMEALIRWQHPQLGLVPPDGFIGLAEECGLIDALTDWVLDEAMQQLARWQSQGLKLQMAVNVSMDNLRASDFSARVTEMARRAGAAPQDLILEITESRLMAPLPPPLENLVRLRMQRFGLSIDDFGTGHSSLAQLRDVPFTELKVDRSFVRGARHNQIIRPILEGSIGIAKRMGMKSVAEGVETQEDWDLLSEIGCDLAQGWFIGRPMPAKQVPEWDALWQARHRSLVGRSTSGGPTADRCQTSF